MSIEMQAIKIDFPQFKNKKFGHFGNVCHMLLLI